MYLLHAWILPKSDQYPHIYNFLYFTSNFILTERATSRTYTTHGWIFSLPNIMNSMQVHSLSITNNCFICSQYCCTVELHYNFHLLTCYFLVGNPCWIHYQSILCFHFYVTFRSTFLFPTQVPSLLKYIFLLQYFVYLHSFGVDWATTAI